MIKKITPEQFWKLYEKLPEELKEAVFSGETADNIWNVCEKNGINEVSRVAKYAGDVLIGLLPPSDFQKTLEKELGIDTETAQKVGREIHRFIFYPVKTCLEELYRVEITGVPTPAKPSTVAPSAPTENRKPSESAGNGETLQAEIEEFAAAGERREEPRRDDDYREPLE